MSRPEDFLVAVQVNQDGVDTYTRSLDGLAVDVERIAQQINAIRLPGLSFRADASLLRKRLRTETQRRARDKTRVVSAMARTSTGLQRAVVKETQDSYVRKAAATGALVALTASARNAAATNNYFGVGNIPMLRADKRVPYALAIEGGSTASLGRVLTGVWAGSRGGVYGFGAPNKGQRFQPMSVEAAVATLRRAHRKVIVRGVITRPILAHHAYANAARSFAPQQKMATEIRRIYGF